MAMLINSTQSMVNHIYDYYLWTLTLSDDRTKGWLLVDSPLPTVIYTVMYLAIVWIGPKLMQKWVKMVLALKIPYLNFTFNLFTLQSRSPYKLTGLLVPYNLSMAILNGYICVQLFTAATRLKYSYVCQPCRANNHPDEMQVSLFLAFLAR